MSLRALQDQVGHREQVGRPLEQVVADGGSGRRLPDRRRRRMRLETLDHAHVNTRLLLRDLNIAAEFMDLWPRDRSVAAVIVRVGELRRDRQPRVRERDQHLHGPAGVVEADPAEIGHTALREVVIVLRRVRGAVGAMAGPPG